MQPLSVSFPDLLEFLHTGTLPDGHGAPHSMFLFRGRLFYRRSAYCLKQMTYTPHYSATAGHGCHKPIGIVHVNSFFVLHAHTSIRIHARVCGHTCFYDSRISHIIIRRSVGRFPEPHPQLTSHPLRLTSIPRFPRPFYLAMHCDGFVSLALCGSPALHTTPEREML